MFSSKTLDQSKKKRQEYEREFEKLYGEKSFNDATSSGIPIKPVYGPEDIEQAEYEEIGMPGVYPYTRGEYPLQYQLHPWGAEFGLGYGLPEDTRKRYDLLRKEGMAGYMGDEPLFFAAFDEVHNQGWDPDHPGARGLVGRCGPTFSTLRDLELLFDGLPMDRVRVMLNTFSLGIVSTAMYIVYCERRSIHQEKLGGVTLNQFYRPICGDMASLLPPGGLRVSVELIKYCVKHMPRWRTISIAGYLMSEAGATPVQEVAFMLATMRVVARECTEVGLSPDDILKRFSNFMAAGNDFFEHIAKVRAYRRMWAKTAKEEFDCKNPRSMKTVIQLKTSGASLTAQQPRNNIIRTAIHTLESVLASPDVIWTTAYDEVLGLPTEESATLGLRTQQIVYNETNIPKISDPLAGCYYLEWLTNKIEEEAYKILRKIDEIGYIECWHSGWFNKEIRESAYKYHSEVEGEKKIVVGVNEFISGEEQKVPVFKVDPRVEEIAIERVKEFKENRDNAKTETALAKMREVAEKVNSEWPKGGDLMPAVLDAARANATMGEMSEVLKDVFGWGYCS